MIKNRIVYGCVLLAAFLFFLFYRGHISHFLFVLALCLPAFSLLFALPTCFSIRLEMAFALSFGKKGEETALQLQIRNIFLFPCSCLRIRIKYQNQLGGQEEALQTEELRMAVGPFRTLGVQRKFSSDFAGKIVAKIERVRICDFLGVFSLPVWRRKSSKREDCFYVLPQQQTLPPSLVETIQQDMEPTAYSTNRPGDDPAEIFQLREYQAGDSLRRIHWKLSDRLDK